MGADVRAAVGVEDHGGITWPGWPGIDPVA